MLDQSFSAKNFRKILDIENRKGNYLEGKFFSEVKQKSKLIQSCRKEFRDLETEKEMIDHEFYEKRRDDLKNELNSLKKERENILVDELEKVSAKVRARNFSFGIKKLDFPDKKSIFVADQTASTFLCLKKLQYNINRLYKVKQGNRYQIICQMREILGDKFPKYIIRTDISSFYESIPSEKLLKKLENDSLLSAASKSKIKRIFFEYKQLTKQETGLPRGIGVSAYLAELYMRKFDEKIRNYSGVIYYTRYVDDIFIVYCPSRNTEPCKFLKFLLKIFKDFELTRNREKSNILTVENNNLKYFEYLGYKFIIQSGEVKLRMTRKKVKKYKIRMELTFSAYDKQFKRSEKRARSLLERRIKFITGNTRLVNSKKFVLSGIYFSNPLLTDLQDLIALDKFLVAKISKLNSERLRKKLCKYSFHMGFETRRYHKFSAKDLSQIVKVWKNVS